MSLKDQKALADPAAKNDHHTALETIESTPLLMSAEITSLLVVIAEVIIAPTGQHLTSSTSQTAKALLKSLNSDPPDRHPMADQIIQNNIEHGKVLMPVAEDEAASMTEAVSQGVALHLVEG